MRRWVCVIAVAALVASEALARDARYKRVHKSPEERAAAAALAEAEPITPRVGGIRWVGNEHLSASQLRGVVFTRSPDWRVWREAPEFSEPTLVGDLERIAALYQFHGFYEATARYALEWNEEGTRVAIAITIDEGPAVELARLDIRVPEDLDVSERERHGLTAALPLIPGERFSPERYARAKQLLLDRLAEAAHPRARIEGGAVVELDEHVAEVEWRVIPGPTVFFGAVAINGLYQVNESTARREIRIVPGQRYSTSALQRTRLALQRQGLYSFVTVQSRPVPLQDAPPGTEPGNEPPPTPPRQTWPVEVRVTERSPYTLDAGIGYSSDESFRGTIGWRNGNFLGDARKLRLTLLYSGILSKFQAEFTQPYFFDPKLSLIGRASLRRETEPAFTANRVLTSVGVSRPITKHWRGRINYEFAFQDVVRTAFGVVLDEPEGRFKTAAIELGIRRQTLDDLLAPTRGTWLDVVVAPAIEEWGSDFDFVGFLVETRGFVPVVGDGVLAARLRIGSLQPIRGTTAQQIPVTSRFYSGGSNTHRGFQYHRMPPVDTFNFNVGGTSLLESSVEWRFRIWRKLGGVAFVDAGLLDLNPWRYPLDKLFWAVGPGVRYDTIVGPIRFDYGVLLNPPTGGGVRHEWFISVGNAF